MADSTESTPLLSRSSVSRQPEDSTRPDLSIEEMIEPYITDLTWPQVFQAMLGFLAYFFAALNSFVSVFTDAKPTWHCVELGNSICSEESNICELPSSVWSWDKPAETSIISEWSLECANSSIIQGLPASSFFMGCLLSGFTLFFIGDAFGRKRMLLVSCLLMSVASFFTAFSSNVWVYSALRFVSGTGRAAIGTCVLVLATECVGKRWQGKIGCVGLLVFAIGFLLLPALAYPIRSYSWRVLYLVISVPAILYCIVFHFCAYESPRWLLVQGREQEAVEALKKFAGPNSEELSWSFPVAIPNQDQSSKGKSKLFFFRILMEKKELLRRLLLCMTIAFGTGLVYYGVALGVGSLGFDLYWGNAFNASLQSVAILMVFFTVSKLEKRRSLLGLCVTSGVCCILLCITTSRWMELEVGLELVAFFCGCTAISLLLIFTAELFPTYIRNSAVAMVYQVLMLGGVLGPVLAAAGGEKKILSYGIFGVSIIATGSLVIFLPETISAARPADAKDGEAVKQASVV